MDRESDKSSSMTAQRSPVEERASPVLVIGPPASGLDAITAVLERATTLSRFPTAGVPGFFQSLVDEVAKHWRTLGETFTTRPDKNLVSNVDPRSLVQMLEDRAASLYERVMPDTRWFDVLQEDEETARMTRSLDLMSRLAPRARFVFVLRQGVESVASARALRPELHLGVHCRTWARPVESWLRFQKRQGPLAFTLRMDSLSSNTQETAQEFASFLDLTESETTGLIEELCDRSLWSHFREFEGYARTVAESPWDEGGREVFLKFCSVAMTGAGYGDDLHCGATP